MDIGKPKTIIQEITDINRKNMVVKSAFKIINEAYSSIGGLKSRGMNTPEEMAINSHSIILLKTKGKITCAIVTKEVITNDYNIKKIVALATDGTADAKKDLAKNIGPLLEHMCIEVSGSAERFIRRAIGDDEFSKISVPAELVPEILNKNTRPTGENNFRYQRTLSDGSTCIKTLIGNIEESMDAIV